MRRYQLFFENVEENNLKFYKLKDYDKIIKFDRRDFISSLKDTSIPSDIKVRAYSSQEKRFTSEWLDDFKSNIKNDLVKYKKKLYPVIRSDFNFNYIVVENDI
jgi:hypothetical protein